MLQIGKPPALQIGKPPAYKMVCRFHNYYAESKSS